MDSVWRNSQARLRGERIISHNAIVGGGTIGAGLLGVAFQSLASHQLKPADYGAVFAIVTLITFVGLPASASTLLMARETSRGRAYQQLDQSTALLRRGNRFLLATGLALSLALALMSPFLAPFLGVSTDLILAAALGIPFGLALPLLLGAFQGGQQFWAFSTISAGQAALKLVAAVGLGRIWGPLGIVSGISLASAVTYGLALLILLPTKPRLAQISVWRPAAKYLAIAVPSTLALGLLLSSDVLLVKHFFPARVAGQYAAVAAIGRAIFWGATGVATVLFPKVAYRGAKGEKDTHLVSASLSLVAFGGAAGLGLIYLFSAPLLTAFSGGAYVAAAAYLPWYALGMTLLGGVAVLIAVHQSRGDPKFLAVLLPLAALEPALILAIHQTVAQVIQVIDLTMAGILIALASLYWRDQVRGTAIPTSTDGVNLEVRVPSLELGSISRSVSVDPPRMRRMRILILSWRCPAHPKAGGAERFTHEVAAHLVSQGHSVEWFTSSFPGAAAEDDFDGIRIVRGGSWWSVYWHAYRHYRRSIRDRFDFVIDEVNVVPFFSHLWSGLPTHLLVFQLHREVWWYQAPKPLALIGFLAEPLYLRVCRDQPALTISGSTESDLRGLGFNASITVLPIGVERVDTPIVDKAVRPTFLYVGRVVPAKRIEHVLAAFAQYRRATGDGRLWLIGTGAPRYLKSLADLAKRLGVGESVSFYGHMPPLEKHRRMAEAHVLLMTSVREGWGLVVTEANVCGTPAIVYDVPGLRDAVRHERTGLVVSPQPKSLCDAMIRITTEPELYRRLVAEARIWGTSFSFDATAHVLQRALEASVSAGAKGIS